MSLPIAGCIAWTAIALIGVLLPFEQSVFIMLFSTGMIFPLSLLIAKVRKEIIFNNRNPFARLMGASTGMVNLLWAIHIPLILKAPEFVPLTLGISLGLHWIIYSWIVQHSLGIYHSILRTMLVLAAWMFFPDNRITAIGLSITAVYILSIFQMSKRKINL